MKRGRFVLLPISDLTRGHATNSYPRAWKQYLAELLKEVQHYHSVSESVAIRDGREQERTYYVRVRTQAAED